MANQLKVAVEDTEFRSVADAIVGLLEHGWSYRRIARELGVHRETVARYDRLRRSYGSKPANPTPGSSGGGDPKPANVTPGSSCFWTSNRSPGPPSFSEPFEDIIKKKLDCGLSGQRIWQDLVSEHGFTGSYSSVKRFVRRLGEGTPLPFRRMECEPGQEAQVDFGTGAWMVDEDGRKRRSHVLRIILSHSRKGYSPVLTSGWTNRS